MNAMTFYWLTRLPAINVWLGCALSVVALVNFILIFANCFGEWKIKPLYQALFITMPLMFLLSWLFILTPSDTQVAAMIELDAKRGRVELIQPTANATTSPRIVFVPEAKP